MLYNIYSFSIQIINTEIQYHIKDFFLFEVSHKPVLVAANN